MSDAGRVVHQRGGEASVSLVWYRQDLRLADNPALQAAIKRGGPVLPVYIWAPEEEAEWPPGAASRWWLHQSLDRLQAALQKLGVRLIIRRGPSLKALSFLVRETRAACVFWNRRYEPAALKRDQEVETQLQAQGCVTEAFDANLLLNPWSIRNKSNKPFRVFTAFWRHCLSSLESAKPSSAPRKLLPFRGHLKSLALETLQLEPRIDWASGFAAVWTPGEAAAAKRLRRFCANQASSYRIKRDRPDQEGTSRLSPHLHFGEIGPRQIWHALGRWARKGKLSESAWKHSRYATELGWREFAHHLLCHFPHTPSQPLRPEFAGFPSNSDARLLKAWQQGKTGYPMVDAGMRELWSTGWMHNRVRMVVASFLVKDLLLPWQEGTRWFWDTLVDADLANNTLGWQWTAGCGADAAPFFRIFNPVSQGEKFDQEGDYVRKWVPELAGMPARWIHQPWNAPSRELQEAEVDLGNTYPHPMVSHHAAREAALRAFQKIKTGIR